MRNDLFGHKSTFESRQQAVEWLFCHEDVDDTFFLCCEALGARCDVVRLRFHYEFWLRWATFEEPFAFTVCELPEIVATQVLMCGGLEGVYLAREAWEQPGIPTETLLATAKEPVLEEMRTRALRLNAEADVSRIRLSDAANEAYLRSLYLMEERFLMSQQAGLWYFTGRNPQAARIEFSRSAGYDVEKGGSIYWSALFPKF